MSTKSRFQLIRNATVVFHYAGKKFLIDPMFSSKGTFPGFPGTVNSHLNNPLVDLPVSSESLTDADAVIVTHLHIDHWDEAAVKALPKDKVIFAQNQDDALAIKNAGFKDVHILNEDSSFENVSFQKTDCQHGTDQAYAIPELASTLGQASGLFFSHQGEKSVYFVGDSIWIDAVESNLIELQPEVIVLNVGFAGVEGLGPVIMGKDDVLKAHEICPQAIIIAMHMETLNHCILSRKELKEFVEEKGISNKVIIPADGEIIDL